jgi:hypothetical protein
MRRTEAGQTGSMHRTRSMNARCNIDYTTGHRQHTPRTQYERERCNVLTLPPNHLQLRNETGKPPG